MWGLCKIHGYSVCSRISFDCSIIYFTKLHESQIIYIVDERMGREWMNFTEILNQSTCYSRYVCRNSQNTRSPMHQDFWCTGWDSKQASREMQVYGHKQMIYFMRMLVKYVSWRVPGWVAYWVDRCNGQYLWDIHVGMVVGNSFVFKYTHTLGRP